MKERKTNRTYSVDDNFFSEIDSEEKAYVLGMLMADGNVCKRQNAIRLRLHSKDEDILFKIKNVIKAESPIYKEKEIYSGLSFSSRQIKKDLERLGCTTNKSLTLVYIANINDDLFRHFIRGYFDGDGGICCRKDKNGKSLDCRASITSSIMFCDAINALISKALNEVYPCYFCTTKSNKTKYISIHGCKKVFCFLNWMYKDSNIYMDRKYNAFKDLEHTLNTRVKYVYQKTINKPPGRPKGWKHTPESLEKMSKASKGIPKVKLFKAVIQKELDGTFIKEWPGMAEVTRSLGIHHSKVSQVCKGLRRTAGGFKWEYAKTENKIYE